MAALRRGFARVQSRIGKKSCKPAKRVAIPASIVPVCNEVLEEIIPPAPVGLLGTLLAINHSVR